MVLLTENIYRSQIIENCLITEIFSASQMFPHNPNETSTQFIKIAIK